MFEKFHGLLVVASTEANPAERLVLVDCLAQLYRETRPNLIVTGSVNLLHQLAVVYEARIPNVDKILTSSQLNPQAMEPYINHEAIGSLAPLISPKYMGVLIMAHPAIAQNLIHGLHASANPYMRSMDDNLAVGIDAWGRNFTISNDGTRKYLQS